MGGNVTASPQQVDVARLQWQARAMMIEEIAFGPPASTTQAVANPTGTSLPAISSLSHLGELQQTIFARQGNQARQSVGSTEADYAPRPWQAMLNQANAGLPPEALANPVHGATPWIAQVSAMQHNQGTILQDERAQRRQQAAQRPAFRVLHWLQAV